MHAIRPFVLLSLFTVVCGCLCSSAFGQSTPAEVSNVQSVTDTAAKAGPRLQPRTGGDVQVIVRLTDPPLAAVVGENAKRTGIQMSSAEQRAYVAQLHRAQDSVMQTIAAYGGRELARVSRAHNAIAVSIEPNRLRDIAALPKVAMVRMNVDYRLALSSTVPYVGAAQLHTLGVDGTGVTVAVLDTGIDYTHRNLDGPGTVAAYTAAYGTSPTDPANTTLDGVFPTTKVVAGFDFVGEGWPNSPRAPDPDPIDFNGHGTHVADIIAGHSLDGLHKGVAPGANLIAIKVCSSVSTSCSGIALLEGLDFALDPNGDDDLSDAADVINMSLGSPYGQFQDDLGAAAGVTARFGVVVVAAAGNDSDRPYIVDSPSSAPEVISVAQTEVPTAKRFPLRINSPANIARTDANTATVDWAPVDQGFTGDVAYVGRGCPIDGATPEDPYLADPAGKVALIDRGVCAVSLKVDRAARAGAIGVLIGLVAPGDAIGFSFGGGTVFVPTLVITQSTSNLIKANIAAPVNVTVSPEQFVPLVGGVVGSSSRGPSYSYHAVKPDIAAPGGSVSAIAGSGDREEAFSGTSGATPMVAGAAALMIQSFPALSTAEIKARLMNSAEVNIFTNPATQPGVLAPITRIGGGELRVNKAHDVQTAAWDEADPFAVSVSFGDFRTTGVTTRQKRIAVHNYSASATTYTITTSFRYASDANGAVVLEAPASVTVPAQSSSNFRLTLTLNASLLPTWTLDGGANGGNGALLQALELDGYVTISGGDDTIHLPWHILPHKAADVQAEVTRVDLDEEGGSLKLSNLLGEVAGRVDVFSLTGRSPRISKLDFPGPGDNFAIIDLKFVGVRGVTVSGEPGVQFAVNTWDVRSHPNYPAEFDVLIDTDGDGTFDYVVFNLENGGFGATGQNVVAVLNLRTNQAVTRLFTDADLDSSNVILTALLSDLGLSPSSSFTFSVLAGDNYFTGEVTDSIEDMTYQLNLPRFVGFGLPATGVPAGGSSTLSIQAPAGGDLASPSQLGLLLMYRDGKTRSEAEAIRVVDQVAP
jgi:minor extracellular serine protease Vpr